MKLLTALLPLALTATAAAQGANVQRWEYARFDHIVTTKDSVSSTSFSWIEKDKDVELSWTGMDPTAGNRFINKIIGRDIILEKDLGFLNIFNALGELGWELVISETDNYDVIKFKNTSYYFKRPITK